MTRSHAPAFLAVLALTAACGKTTGQTVVTHTRLTSDLGADRSFTTSYGWTVTLEEARLATGPLYYFDGEPAFTALQPGRLWRLARWLSPVQSAWAHPGHYVPGNAMGQMLQPFSADLLAGEVSLPDGTGITGTVRSATFSFSAPSAGPEVAALAGHSAVTRGRATKDGATVYFVLDAELADVARTAKDGQVTGCTFEEAEIEADATVTVTVKPKVWFSLVDFSQVPPGSADAPTVVDPASTPHIAFALGLAQLSAYQLSLTP